MIGCAWDNRPCSFLGVGCGHSRIVSTFYLDMTVIERHFSQERLQIKQDESGQTNQTDQTNQKG